MRLKQLKQLRQLQSNKKGLLFTLDALFAIAVISIAAYSFIAFSQQQWGLEKIFGLQQLGRDYLKLQCEGLINENEFQGLTGLSISTTPNAFQNARLVAHASVFDYPPVCGGQSEVNATDPCLTTQEIENNSFYYEAWLTP